MGIYIYVPGKIARTLLISLRVSCGTPSKNTVWKAVAMPRILFDYIQI